MAVSPPEKILQLTEKLDKFRNKRNFKELSTVCLEILDLRGFNKLTKVLPKFYRQKFVYFQELEIGIAYQRVGLVSDLLTIVIRPQDEEGFLNFSF